MVKRIVLMFLLGLMAWAQPNTPKQMGREIGQLLDEFLHKGSRPYDSTWPSGSPKEKLDKDSDGNINFTRFFPTGGYAVRYQRKPGKVIKLERYYGNGKTEILISQDERIIDYTSYWENGNKKAKYQRNLQTQQVYYDAHDQTGKQIYPPTHP